MGLELRRGKDEQLRSKWWYGRYTINGKRRFVNLGVEVKGSVPKNLHHPGNTLFECSRTLAAAKLKDLITEAQSRKTAAHHLQELYEIKGGEEIAQVPLTDMEEHWLLLPEKRKRSAQQVRNQKANLRQFREFIEGAYPQAKVMSQITCKMALAWMHDLDEKRMSGASYNVKLSLLRNLYGQLGTQAGIVTNPFNGIPYREQNTIHRQPFTPAELNAILEHCDELIRPVVLTGMCTAMRRGDCCMLKWESVDLDQGFISVKTSKTGELAEIPLFPLLRAELEKLPRNGMYCFPQAAEMYKTNIHGISWRFQKALKSAGITDTLVERDDASQKASVKDFHSLRTTWITMALTAGVPMELVRRVTGHSTVDVVLKHYFRPGRDAFKTALETAMPHMLTGDGQKKITPRDTLLELAEKAEGLSKEELVKEMLKIAESLAA